jgi:hypothetical protein
MAGALQTMAEDLRAGLAADLPDWGGAAVEAYRSMMNNNVDGLGGPAVHADTMSAATQRRATWSSSLETSSAT